MIRNLILIAMTTTLVGCGGDGTNPFQQPAEDDAADGGGETPTDGGSGIDSGPDLPPGTASPTPNDGIFRREASDGDGNGMAEGISYDSASDTFTVDNLAFDGGNTYARDARVASLGPFAVYENDDAVIDNYNGQTVNQFTHKAIYGVSTSGNSKFAIVRTGSYVNYGFGGFIYQRDGGVVIPQTGQGSYTGSYAGLRDFDGRGGLEYASADMAIAVDFEDFNAGGGIRGQVTNRRIFDLAGTDITGEVVSAVNAEYGSNLSTMPVIRFVIGPNAASANGEASNGVYSNVTDLEGTVNAFESGNYYAILSGDNAEEIVGVVVTEAPDPRFDGVTVRETGGFVVYR